MRGNCAAHAWLCSILQGDLRLHGRAQTDASQSWNAYTTLPRKPLSSGKNEGEKKKKTQRWIGWMNASEWWYRERQCQIKGEHNNVVMLTSPACHIMHNTQPYEEYNWNPLNLINPERSGLNLYLCINMITHNLLSESPWHMNTDMLMWLPTPGHAFIH